MHHRRSCFSAGWHEIAQWTSYFCIYFKATGKKMYGFTQMFVGIAKWICAFPLIVNTQLDCSVKLMPLATPGTSTHSPVNSFSSSTPVGGGCWRTKNVVWPAIGDVSNCATYGEGDGHESPIEYEKNLFRSTETKDAFQTNHIQALPPCAD